ncbi:acyloxyacyl hydrolase [Thalassotalea sp. Y01]|uniref:acyloxyacyl hydrolase n=1 Tax=Thalassotalea sp. Y01 TaxID=2729613 RepID=UPI00145ECB65|nr:acyloxyacyl hydrolase [Thalassotalea sp. Y01]NMP17460.1 acyloxyacyl hydrolase [Thalassotalea sp. Y01]
MKHVRTKSILVVLSLCFVTPIVVAIQDKPRVTAGFGVFGAVDKGQISTIKLGYEFMPWEEYWGIRPLMQIMVNDYGAYYASIGLSKEFKIVARWPKWRWGMMTSIGYYHEDSNDNTDELGHEVEFYTAIMASYKLNTQSSIRIELGHISNGGIGNQNPGSEAVLVTYLASF